MTDHDPLRTCTDCGHRIRLDVEQMIRADERERVLEEFGISSMEEILQEERERIAKAIRAERDKWQGSDDRYRMGSRAALVTAEHLARNGGRDE